MAHSVLVTIDTPDDGVLYCDICHDSEVADCHSGGELRQMFCDQEGLRVCEVCLRSGKYDEVE